MPHVLNFDTLTYDTVEITKGDKHWTLRDDVPTKILMRAFGTLAIGERLRRATQEAQAQHTDNPEAAIAALQARFDALERETASHVGDIFRHTYPKTTDEELLAVFSFEQLQGIVQLFFTLRSNKSSLPHDATSAPSTATTTVVSQQKTNRATRRATAKRS